MNIDRKLASIRTISEIFPIPNADKIEGAKVDGWEVVVIKANNFKAGDKVVYYEIDSLLPEIEMYEFLRPQCYVNAEKSVNGAGFRIRTMKMRGQISQGMTIPLHHFKEPLEHLEVGTDLTEVLGIRKFERPLPTDLDGIAIGQLPYNIPKTDEERIQNNFDTLAEELATHEWEVTVKLDGASMTVYYDVMRDHVGVCSRNTEFAETAENGLWRVVRRHGLDTKLRALKRNIAIQGEIMGPGVQGNKEKLNEIDMFVFNVFDKDKRTYLVREEREQIVRDLGLQHVPTLEVTKFAGYGVKDFLKLADGPSLNPKTKREGLVFKSITDPKVSFKVISNSWLLKTGE